MASCAICDKPALFRCGKCKVERYCSRECQKDHWPHHKTRCAQLAATAKPTAPCGAAAVDAVESTISRPQPPPQPPPTAAPLQPHTPSRPSPGEHFGPPRSNPRTARLLGELPPSLQPDAGPTTPQPAGASPAAAAPCTSASNTLYINSEGLTAVTAASEARGAGDSGSEPPPVRLSPHPPPQPPVASQLGPGTPLPLQPAPPSGSPRAPPGRASMRFVRPHLRDSPAVAAAAAGGCGGLQVEGSGLLSVGNGSILDRVMLPPPGRPDDDDGGPAAAAASYPGGESASFPGGESGAAASSAAQPRTPLLSSSDWGRHLTSEPQPPHGAATFLTEALITTHNHQQQQQPEEQQPEQQQQQPEHFPPWPWAARPNASAAGSAPATGAVPSLSELPPEVLLEVLKALPARSLAAAAAVCRSWRRAAREPWLWVRQLCAAGYPLPAAVYVAQRQAAAAGTGAAGGAGEAMAPGPAALRVVPGVRGIRAVRAVRAAGGSSHEAFLGGLRAGFLDRLQQQEQPQERQQQQPQHLHGSPPPGQQQQQPQLASTAGAVDLKELYGRTVRMESNWRSARFAESALREHSSNVECLAFQRVDPWGCVLLSAAWDGSVRVFALGPAGAGGGGGGGGGGGPQQARCVRRYRGHTGWITCMAAGRHQVVTASTDRRVAAWRYYSESSDPWVALEHPQEVTLVRFCYAPPPPATTQYLAHHICAPHDPGQPAAATAAAAARGTASAYASSGSGDAAAAAGAPGASQHQHHGSAAGVVGTAGAVAAQLGGGLLYDNYGGETSQGCSREALALALPYDPQWEDWVVTGCIDGVIRLWHLPTKQQLRTFTGHGDVVWGIAVPYGSSIMVSSSRDCTTKLWRLPPYGTMQAAVAAAPLPGAATAAAAEHALGDGGSGTSTAAGVQLLDAVATLCGHSSAILCMDVHRAPAGVVPPSAAAKAAPAAADAAAAAAMAVGDADVGSGGEGRAWRSAGLGPYDDMITVLSYLLNTGLVETAATSQAAANGGVLSGGGGGEDLASMAAAAKAAGVSGKVAAGALPVWLVATGGADAVVRVWNLATAQCHVTLRGHSVGVLSVQFGYLPRRSESYREQVLLPPDLDLTAAAPPPSLALPPGQYGGGGGCSGGSSGGSSPARPQRLPPSQRLVLVTGSVREVRVWDPVSGAALAQLSDHSGPVTSLGLIHGALVTLAMNDGLIVYKCNGIDGPEDAASGGGGGAAAASANSSARRPASAAGRLRREVAAHRRILEPVICLQDAPHHSFSAALAAHLEGLAVGSGTGDITYLDFRPYPSRGAGPRRAAPLPLLPARRRSPPQQDLL